MVDFVQDANFRELSRSIQPSSEPMTRSLFISLMKQFYDLSWMKGTGGAMGCLSSGELIISPSSLQKERLTEEDLFVYNVEDKSQVQHAVNPKISVSSCAVLFSLVMNQTGSTCVVHTHSKAANLVTQLTDGNYFEISHQEYIKGVWDPFTGKNLGFEDTLSIPIIENKSSEHLLLPALADCLKTNPRSCAVLVRNHGLFVWGPTWEQAKIMTECIDYLLDLAINMIGHKLPLVQETRSVTKTESDYQISFDQ